MIAIVDYKAGNLRSVERALDRLGFASRITRDRDGILTAERVIFPGVGAAGTAMEDLQSTGVDVVLREARQCGMPFLGICLGAQVILERSDEGDVACLGLLEGKVVRFPEPLLTAESKRLKVPHMGWNGLRIKRPHPVLDGVREAEEFYFVHEYYPQPAEDHCVLGVTDHGISFPSVIGEGNLVATQFHPEKSGIPGLRILENFCRWDGRHVE
jgi:imidazole glycerol-phosphate synthase subunit HisH